MILFPLAISALTPTSGEAMLDALFQRYEKLKNVEVSISKCARDAKDQALVPGFEILLRYVSPTRFRVDAAEYWGGGGRYVCDGKTFLFESADGWAPAQLRNAAPLMEAHPDLNLRGSASSYLYAFMKGREMKSRLLVPGSPIASGRNWIRFATKEAGTMTLTLSNGWISEIAFDNRPGRLATYVMLPMWYEKPDDPLEIEAITYRFNARFPRSLFDTRPPKGGVQDLRKKG